MQQTARDREGVEVAVDDSVRWHPESKPWRAGEKYGRIVQINNSRIFARCRNTDRRVEVRSVDFYKEDR